MVGGIVGGGNKTFASKNSFGPGTFVIVVCSFACRWLMVWSQCAAYRWEKILLAR